MELYAWKILDMKIDSLCVHSLFYLKFVLSQILQQVLLFGLLFLFNLENGFDIATSPRN